eukprot:scaffold14526_cov144-Isochrysis_galbana.AAC.1
MGSFAAPRRPTGSLCGEMLAALASGQRIEGELPYRPIRPTGRFEGRRDELVCIKNNQERGNVGVAPPTASHWALRPRPLTCRRHWTGFSGVKASERLFVSICWVLAWTLTL